MNTTPTHSPLVNYMRPAIIVGAENIGLEWIDIDPTGAVPETWNGRERCTKPDSVIAIYRDPAKEFSPERYGILGELVAIAEGAPVIDNLHDTQMKNLREAFEEALGTADTARELWLEQQRITELVIAQARGWKAQAVAAQVDLDAHLADQPRAIRQAMNRAEHADELLERERGARVNAIVTLTAESDQIFIRAQAAEMRALKIQAEARRWKDRALAAESEADALHATITSAETRARIAEGDRNVLERKLDNALEGKRHAVEFASDLDTQLQEARKNALDVITRVTQCIPIPDAVVDADVEFPDFQIDTYFGAEDNIPVVQIDTIGMAGRCRVNLNDGVIWDGDPEEDERPGSNAEPIIHEKPQQQSWEKAREHVNARAAAVAENIEGMESGAIAAAFLRGVSLVPSGEGIGSIEPAPVSSDAERLEVRRQLEIIGEQDVAIRGLQDRVNEQAAQLEIRESRLESRKDVITEHQATIDRLRSERRAEEKRADSAEEQVRINSDTLERVQADLNDARAAQQVSANAGHEYGKRIWAIVRDAVGVAGDPIPAIKELREQRDAATHLAEALQTTLTEGQANHAADRLEIVSELDDTRAKLRASERYGVRMVAERDVANQELGVCQRNLSLASEQVDAWHRVLKHPALLDVLGTDGMTANQAVGYRLTELANIEQKWNAQPTPN